MNRVWGFRFGELVFLAFALMPGLVAAQEATQSNPQASPAGGQESPRTPTAYVDRVEVTLLDSEKTLSPIRRPLFSYDDSVRHIREGGIWAWGEGRPQAMIKSWRNPDGRRTRAFSLTSEELVIARGPQSKVWRPTTAQVAARPLLGAPPPDRNETVRLRQLKEQARRFSANERWDPENSRSEMRLLVQPVHRYRDDERQVVDGAVFVLAVDNNPQVLLLFETLAAEANGSRWQYLLARVSSAELHVAIDGQEVWNQDRTPGIVGKPTDPYWHMVTLPLDGSAP